MSYGNLGRMVGMGPEPVLVHTSMVSGGKRRKGEFFLPIATCESGRADAKLLVEAMPQMPCRVTGFYVGGETFRLAEPETVVPGQHARFEVPERPDLRARAGKDRLAPDGLEGTVCGMFTEVLAPPSFYGAKSSSWKLPLGARIVKEQIPSKLAIAPGTTFIVQWMPEVACRFKRFALEALGDMNQLFLNDLRFGKDSLFMSNTPVPLPVASEPGAIEIPDVIVPGIIVTASFSSRSGEEIVLGGGLVFENAEEQLAEIQKKYEQELAERAKAGHPTAGEPGDTTIGAGISGGEK